MIIDGGPRKIFNTASMLKKFAEGAASVDDQIEIKTVRLYELDYSALFWNAWPFRGFHTTTIV